MDLGPLCGCVAPLLYSLTNHRWGYPVVETGVAESVRSGSAAKAINLKVAVTPLRRVRHRFESANADPKDGYTPTDENDGMNPDPKDDKKRRNDNDTFTSGDPRPWSRRDDD